jgi:subtilisin-like proprotein convertase family protein
MKRKPVWILAAIVAALLASSLFWNFSMPAAGAASRKAKKQATADTSDKDFFDIRNKWSKDAAAKLERRMEKLSPKQKERNENFKLGLKSAREIKARRAPDMEVSFCSLTNAAEVVEMKGRGPKFLTPSSTQPRESVVKSFINENSDVFGMNPQQVAKLRKIAEYTNPNGKLSWVKMEQRWNGMRVFQGETLAAFSSGGALVRMVGGLTGGDLELDSAPKVSATSAVVAAAASIGVNLAEGDLTIKGVSPDGNSITFNAAAPFTDDITAELMLFPLDANAATLAWSMVLWQHEPAYYTLVDAQEGTGVLWRKNITRYQTQPATYSIYNDDSPAPLSPTSALPGSGVQGSPIARTLVTLISELPAFDNLGWITDGVNTTTGNNVDAGLDIVSPNGIDVDGRPVGSPFRVFDFPYNPSPGDPAPGDAPTIANYRMGAVTNLFFWTNRYHDRLYELGFTEAARNFQQDNFGRGGLGNDRVLAEAQDFSGTNNANFATPPDGSSGRMQMYIFTGPNPDRDGDLDQEIVIHELTHGVSNRLHANASGLNTNVAGGMGEGWGDYYARALLSTADEDVNGLYASGGYATLQLGPLGTDNFYYGIRRFPYAVKTAVGANGKPHNPLTFADTDPAQLDTSDGAFPESPLDFSGNGANEVHNLGEIWCLTLLEMRARLITRLGFATGNQRALQLATDGMKLEPADPNMLQGRDAILAADCAGFGGSDELDIWAGFAARGMGFSARYNSATSVTEAFDTPNLTLGAVTVSDDTCPPPDGFADPGESLTLTIPLSNPFCATSATGVTVSVDGGAPVSYGDIAAGSTTARGIPFTVPAAAVCGSQLPVSVAITSSLGTVTKTFSLQIGRPVVTINASYATGNIAVPIPDVSSVDIPISVTDVGAVADINVRVRLNHTFDGDLSIALISPDGTSVALANNRGGAGDNYGSGSNDCSGVPTVFDDSATTAIGAGTAPFAGSFRPDTPLSAFNGKGVAGTWILRVSDGFALDTGTVGCVTLDIARQRFACCGVAGTPEIQAAPPVTLANESCMPGNGAPDPDETVTINFPLSNVGTDNTSNLVATLLPGGGVLAPSAPQSYGVLVPGGPAVARPFTFTVAGLCGGDLVATLALQDGATSFGTATFTIRIGGTATATSSFSNPTAITIPATGTGAATGAPATPYPSNITVSGISGTVSKVTVDLFNFNHTFPSDVDVLLVGPGGQKMILLSDAGGGTDAVNANLTFDDAAPGVGATIVTGTFSPTNIGAGDLFPAPAPAGPYPDPQRLSVFNGVNPNGTWSLYVVDDAGVDTGNINGGWRLNITTSDPACCNTPCALIVPANITVNNDPGMCGAVVNYTAPTFTGSCGVVTSNPPSGSFFPVGVSTVTVTGTRQDGTVTVSSFTVTVNAPSVTTVPAVAGQYSDQVTLTANVANAACPGGNVEFKVNGAVAGTAPVVNGKATLPYTIQLAKGSYPITATYSSSSPGTGSVGSGTLTVAKEDAIVTPAASNPKDVKVNHPGGTAGPIKLCAAIKEVSDGSLGDISLATPVTFTLRPAVSGTPTITQTATTTGGGVGGTLNACVTLNNVKPNVYDVSISVGGNNYTGSGAAVLVVFDPSPGFVTGAGTITRNGSPAAFAFNARFERDCDVGGALVYVERRQNREVKLEIVSVQSLAVVGNTGVLIGRAIFNGGDCVFRATVIDNDLLGKRDKFGLQVTTPSGAIIQDLTFDPITLSSGNIVVPHR